MKAKSEEMLIINQLNIRVSIRGTGQPLLMFNGLGAHIEIFDQLRGHLKSFRTIAFDVPGVGQSSRLCRLLRFRHYADIAAALLDQLEIDQANIFGVSWGGALAQEFTLRHPGRVRNVVLAATTAGPGILMRPKLYLSFLDPRDRASDEYIDMVAPDLYGGKMRTQIRARREMMSSYLEEKISLSYFQQMVAAAGWTSILRLRKIEKSVLMIAGDEDPIIRPYNAFLLGRLIRNSEVTFIEGEGHFFIVTSPKQTAGFIEEFLMSKSSSPVRSGMDAEGIASRAV